MQFDVDTNLAATDRAVSSPEHDGQPACAVTLSRAYATTVDDLWDAVTSAEPHPPLFRHARDWRPRSSADATSWRPTPAGPITECEPPSRYAVTWEFGGDTSWVEVRVSGERRQATPGSPSPTPRSFPTHWDTFGPGATGVGWETRDSWDSRMHLASPDWPKPDPEEFAVSPDGRAFHPSAAATDGAGQRPQAGEDPDTATAAARRTAAFYTGEPADSE